MKKKKKILVIIKSKNSAAGTFVYQFLKLKKDFDIKICVLENEELSQFEVNKPIIYFNMGKHQEKGFNLNPNSYIRVVREAYWLWKVIELEKPDLVLTVDIRCSVLLGLLNKFFLPRIGWIATARNNIIEIGKRKNFIIRNLLKIVGHNVLRTANIMICVSNGVGKSYEDFFLIKLKKYVIPDGLNTREVKRKIKLSINQKHLKLLKNGKKNVISIGRFEEQKDFETLIKSFSLVKQRFNNIQLILIGDGSQKICLQDLVKKLNLSDSVHFLGWKSNVYPYISKSDIFVLSTKYEGFSYVILEAMACGIPVISTDAPYGPAEILNNGEFGILTTIADVKKMSSSIASIIFDNNKSNYFKKKSFDRIKDFREKDMLVKYKKIIDEFS